ncbi:MAG: alpha/beta hydrolase, partial [Actinobacteria bacterium]|nr:alpha/beta hydrolase [Actinomycetota bacterium]
LFMDRTLWTEQVEALRDRYRVITPDLRNHGESEAREEDHTQWDLMEDHIALLDHLGVDKAVFGGQSQGGFQSLRAALKHPERVDGLILIDTQAGAEDPTLVPIYESMLDVYLETGWNDILLESAAAMLMGGETPTDVKANWMQRWRDGFKVGAKQALAAVNHREDITDRLGEIQAPALVLHGEIDAAISMERAEALAGGLKGLVEFVKLPHAGHASPVETPDAVTEPMERFLSKVTGT